MLKKMDAKKNGTERKFTINKNKRITCKSNKDGLEGYFNA